MTEYIHYFWVDFDSMGRFPLFRNAFMILCCVVLVIVIRRLTASLRSGGSFFEAYRIAEGNFYIHGAIQFGPEDDSFKRYSLHSGTSCSGTLRIGQSIYGVFGT